VSQHNHVAALLSPHWRDHQSNQNLHLNMILFIRVVVFSIESLVWTMKFVVFNL